MVAEVDGGRKVEMRGEVGAFSKRMPDQSRDPRHQQNQGGPQRKRRSDSVSWRPLVNDAMQLVPRTRRHRHRVAALLRRNPPHLLLLQRDGRLVQPEDGRTFPARHREQRHRRARKRLPLRRLGHVSVLRLQQRREREADGNTGVERVEPSLAATGRFAELVDCRHAVVELDDGENPEDEAPRNACKNSGLVVLVFGTVCGVTHRRRRGV